MPASARPLVRYLEGGAPPAPNAARESAREADLLRRAALGLERFLEPERPRLAEARSFFAPARGAGDAALLSRWEGAAAAGLIPPEWVEAPPFVFRYNFFPGQTQVRPQPPSAGAAVTVAADVGGFLAATAFCEDIARTLSTWNNSAFKSGGPWLSAAQWETRRAVRPAIVWTEATPKTEPHEERWDYQSINEEFDDPNSWRVGARRHARGAVVATALRAKATGWVDGAAKGGPRPSAHLRRYSALENVDVPWWRRFVTVVRSALVADAARELCIGPYDLDADLPNPFERILDVWGLGYVWLGENIDRSGEETRWLAALRPDDFGEGRGGP